MINGITTEFGQVLFDNARVPAENMIGAPGEGWRLAMTIVSHEREPGELGYVAALREDGQGARARGARGAGPAFAPTSARPSRGRTCRPRCCASTCRRRLSERLDGVEHGPGGSIDKLLMTWVEQSVGAAALAGVGIARGGRRRRRRAEGVSLQSRPERHGRHVADPEEHRRDPHPRPAHDLNARNRSELRPPRRRPRRGRRAGSHRAAVASGAAQRDQRGAPPRLDAACSRNSAPTPTRASRSSPAKDARSRPAATSISSTGWRKTARSAAR